MLTLPRSLLVCACLVAAGYALKNVLLSEQDAHVRSASALASPTSLYITGNALVAPSGHVVTS